MMPTPPFAMAPPPLPPGWTEHLGPMGQPYYHNSQTKESTYIRPLPAFPILPQGVAPSPSGPSKKKEKPLIKTPIPGTEWLRVTTTEGNVFYTHKAKKQSVWTIPDEIKEAVQALEKQESEEKKAEDASAHLEHEEAAQRDEEERSREVERIKSEVQDMVGKRKADEIIPVEEVLISKKARIEEDDEDEEEDEEDASGDEDDESEEEWQREAAAQLADEAEEEKKKREEERKRQEEEAKIAKELEDQKGKPQLNMPERVDLSIEEAKALFKTLLREKDISPLHPWDTSLPLFISDPRYVLLPSVTARREAFDEYCRDRARELRQSQVKKEKDIANPRDEFDRLLRDEVKSTRTSWSEWRRTWKKERRFYGWGRDDREREKRFRDYLKELGEKKREAAQKAEADFFALLKESGIAKPGAVWKEVKHSTSRDPRYDAVGSSSLREELFNTFLKAHGSVSSLEKNADTRNREASPEDVRGDTEVDKQRERQERRERAVREREEKVKAERSQVEASIDRSRMDLNKEEGELVFRTMLTDAIQDPTASWDSALPQLKTDPRFTQSPLPVNRQFKLFHDHNANLRAKPLANLRTLFESHSPSLDTSFTSLPVSSLLTSLPATKLGFDVHKLEDEYEKWQRERTHEARLAFDQMLSENSFVEFWGRLGKIGGKGVDESIKVDDLGEDAEAELVDMKALAKNVDLKEMIKVLQNDKRYLMFDHVPEQRERWLRDYLASLSAPSLSVHVPEHA